MTGIKQTTIAYKVSRPGGVPLDVYGVPISVSGRRQAIALLEGRPNPNPALYEIETFFNVGDYITGNPTQAYDPVQCPVGYMFISPSMLVLSPDNPERVFTLFSTNPWSFVSGPDIATILPTSGANGAYSITATRTGILGQGPFIFQNNVTLETVNIYIVNTNNPALWILDTGEWNMMGFWFRDAIWNY